MNNIVDGSARTYNSIHQSHVLVNVRLFLINAHGGMQCSATSKGRSFALNLPRGLVYRRVWEPDYRRGGVLCCYTTLCIQVSSIGRAPLLELIEPPSLSYHPDKYYTRQRGKMLAENKMVSVDFIT